MTQRIEFFFDLSSPWTCIAFHNVRPLLADTDVEILWRPFLVGGIHNAVNQGYVESRANDLASPKWRQLARSLMDWVALVPATWTGHLAGLARDGVGESLAPL